jgi:hypothetical protein
MQFAGYPKSGKYIYKGQLVLLIVTTMIKFKITGQICHLPLQKNTVSQIAVKYV